MKIVPAIVVCLLCLSAVSLPAQEQQTITVAVASNFIRPMDEIAAEFEADSGITVRKVYSSTGKLYAQIKYGAPYDLFLAADSIRPEYLNHEGLCGEPFEYVRGQVVLWSGRDDLGKEVLLQDVIRRDDVKKIAIPSPETAPYGYVAMEHLKKNGLLKMVQKRLVFAQNAAQSFQYGSQLTVDATFTALSFALSDKGKRGKYWPLPKAPLIVQKGCVISKAASKKEIATFLAFLDSGTAANIKSSYGYQ